MKTHATTCPSGPNLHSVWQLLNRFRQRVLHHRATLPKPGYHGDLSKTAVAQTTAFLDGLPSEIVLLVSHIHAYRSAGGRVSFDVALAELNSIRREPLRVFHTDAAALEERLSVAAPDRPGNLLEKFAVREMEEAQ